MKNKRLFDAYRKMAAGGDLEQDEFGNLVTTASAIGTGIIDAAGSGDPITGRRSIGSSVAKGGLSGAATGARIGGPLGAAIGAGVGSIAGLIRGRKDRREARADMNAGYVSSMLNDNMISDALVGGNPELATGYRSAGYYANGGSITDQPPVKKKAQPLYVTNKNDSRLRAYNDSLKLYNAGEKLSKLTTRHMSNLGITRTTMLEDEREAYKGINITPEVRTKMRISSGPTYIPVWDNGNPTNEHLSINRYKKPVQPVVYQPEVLANPTQYKSKGKITITSPQPVIDNTTLTRAVKRKGGTPAYGPNNSYIGDRFPDGTFSPADPAGMNKADRSIDINKYLKTKLANGGQAAPLTHMLMRGGSASKMSEESSELRGRSHAEGGIQIPGMGAEVEGGETESNGYIFSRQLGFADLHKPIAKAIGKIEKKPMTGERITSLKLLRDRERRLAESQEQVKQQLNLQ